MPSIRKLAGAFERARKEVPKSLNWHPGHMYAGMQAMIGKLSTVDCVIEVHDARIPFIGRNKAFREHLGVIKPHILVLNKGDLADLSQWKYIRDRLNAKGDKNVFLTELSGSQFSHSTRGYQGLLDKVITVIGDSDRHNRSVSSYFKIMIVGIPNVGKSTLINRLRQYHLGLKGDASRTGNTAGVTRHVEHMIKISSRPLIYSIDTPGVLAPSATKNHASAMQLALCSTINDRAINPYELAKYLLGYLHEQQNFFYLQQMELEIPPIHIEEFCQAMAAKHFSQFQVKSDKGLVTNQVDTHRICWKFVHSFREGLFGKVMFD